MNLPDGTGLFTEMFTQMQMELKQNPRRSQEYGMAAHMSPEEKRISFMNRYFVFKKVRSVDAKKMADIIAKKDIETEEVVEKLMTEPEPEPAEQEQSATAPEPKLAETVVVQKPARKVTKRKVVLNQIPTDK
jgi:hypothetical protein